MTPRGRKAIASDLQVDSFQLETSSENLASSEEGDDLDSEDSVTPLTRAQAAEALGGMFASGHGILVSVPVPVTGFMGSESEPPTRKSKSC